MDLHVVPELLLFLKGGAAQITQVWLVSGVGPADVAVVSRMGGEGLTAVLALERPLSGVLADVSPQNTGGGEGLNMQLNTNFKFWSLFALL